MHHERSYLLSQLTNYSKESLSLFQDITILKMRGNPEVSPGITRIIDNKPGREAERGSISQLNSRKALKRACNKLEQINTQQGALLNNLARVTAEIHRLGRLESIISEGAFLDNISFPFAGMNVDIPPIHPHPVYLDTPAESAGCPPLMPWSWEGQDRGLGCLPQSWNNSGFNFSGGSANSSLSTSDFSPVGYSRMHSYPDNNGWSSSPAGPLYGVGPAFPSFPAPHMGAPFSPPWAQESQPWDAPLAFGAPPPPPPPLEQGSMVSPPFLPTVSQPIVSPFSPSFNPNSQVFHPRQTPVPISPCPQYPPASLLPSPSSSSICGAKPGSSEEEWEKLASPKEIGKEGATGTGSSFRRRAST
ncbi:MAG: hypothetical protein M1829_005007 [Trizodia sp. TS-e1964]|nr:MAG: hypothetical protein M1829_005007 [Trizodia sp. TS-e1964]